MPLDNNRIAPICPEPTSFRRKLNAMFHVVAQSGIFPGLPPCSDCAVILRPVATATARFFRFERTRTF